MGGCDQSIRDRRVIIESTLDGAHNVNSIARHVVVSR